MKDKKILYCLFILSFAVIWGGFSFTELESMSPNWTGPYYSGSSNLTFGGDFLVSENDVKNFLNLDDSEKEKKYIFHRNQDLVYYNHNPIGYCYILAVSKFFFGSFGDLKAAVILQIIFYLLLSSILIIYLNLDNKSKIILFILFLLNPFIIRFTLFNFYYFWFIIPIFLSVIYITESKVPRWIEIALFIISCVVLSFRPTFILVFVFILLWSKYKFGWKDLALKLFILLSITSITFRPSQKNFYHTAYVGIGAYPNELNVTLSDNESYDLYFKETGEKLLPSFGGNYYSESVINKYKLITKKHFFSYLVNNPIEYFRNIFLNAGQSFSIGYISILPYEFKIIISLLGWITILIFLKFKLYFVTFLLLANTVTIALYYPPIPAYIIGNYLLLSLGLVKVLKTVYPLHKLSLK